MGRHRGGYPSAALPQRRPCMTASSTVKQALLWRRGSLWHLQAAAQHDSYVKGQSTGSTRLLVACNCALCRRAKTGQRRHHSMTKRHIIAVQLSLNDTSVKNYEDLHL